jgi:hypothetical protein
MGSAEWRLQPPPVRTAFPDNAGLAPFAIEQDKLRLQEVADAPELRRTEAPIRAGINGPIH